MSRTLSDRSDLEQQLDDLTERGLALYEAGLKEKLEREHMGKVVAIHPDSGDYLVADSSSDAMFGVCARHPKGTFFITRIGPATAGDERLAARILGRKFHSVE